MDLKTTVHNDVKVALKSGESLKVSTLRLLLAEIKKREIDKRSSLTDAEVIRTISTLIKQRNEAIDLYVKGARQELADKERKEIEYLKSYLPEPLSDEELEALVKLVVEETQASLPKDKGKVIKASLEKAGDRADGKRIAEIVGRLSSPPQS